MISFHFTSFHFTALHLTCSLQSCSRASPGDVTFSKPWTSKKQDDLQNLTPVMFSAPPPVELWCSGRAHHFISLDFTSFHFTSFHFTSLHFTSCHFVSLHFILLHFSSLQSCSGASLSAGMSRLRSPGPQQNKITSKTLSL